jgi:GT2 family glycosyltransferase
VERRRALRVVDGSSPEVLARNEVSVIVVNHNAGALLVECVHRASKQAREVIVVDNASSDGSLLGIQDDAGSECRVEVALNARNLGFSVACNMGAALASGKYLLFLNPDCMIDPGALGQMLRTLGHDRQVGMVGGFLSNPDGTEQPGGRRAIPTPWRSFVRAFGLSRFCDRWPKLFASYDLCVQPIPTQPVEVEAVSGACMLVRRNALEDVGPLDEGYFMHCEDLDWCMRFRQHGWKVVFVPSATVVHHLGACSRARPVFVEWHKHKGMVRFYRKFFSHQYPGPLLFAVVGAVWVRFLAKLLVIHTKRLFGSP